MHDALFQEFTENAKKNNYEEAAHILNTGFYNSAEKRAAFGKRYGLHSEKKPNLNRAHKKAHVDDKGEDYGKRRNTQ